MKTSFTEKSGYPPKAHSQFSAIIHLNLKHWPTQVKLKIKPLKLNIVYAVKFIKIYFWVSIKKPVLIILEPSYQE